MATREPDSPGVVTLASGPRISKLDALMQLLKHVQGNADFTQALRDMFDNSAAKHAVIHKQSLHLGGSIRLDRNSFRPPLAAIAVIGDLTIDGCLLAHDYNLDTMLFVTGSLRVQHMVKGWMPVIVLGGVHASGYVLGEGTGGLLRVGGDLNAAGYVQLREDSPPMRGHVISGKINARTAAADHKRFFVPEVMREGLLDPGSVIARHDSGLPVWRDKPEPPKPRTKPLRVKLKRAALPAVAEAIPASEAAAMMLDRIARARGSQAQDFSEFVPGNAADALRLADGTVIEGDLILDGPDILCDGTLRVTGDIVNDNLDSGPILFTAGDLHAGNIRKGGSPFLILGSVNATGAVIAEYNHGVIRVGGDLHARLLLVMDHDVYIGGECGATVVDTDEADPMTELNGEAFDGEELISERVHALARSGRPLLQT